jgi:hypothetical protein
VELITPHRTINYHENRKGGQGPVWAVAPLIIIIDLTVNNRLNIIRNDVEVFSILLSYSDREIVPCLEKCSGMRKEYSDNYEIFVIRIWVSFVSLFLLFFFFVYFSRLFCTS